MTELRDDLIAARTLIVDPDAWAKGSTDDGGNCAITACNHLARAVRAYNALWHALPENWQRRTESLSDVFDYNDDPATTHADIMALYDRAIQAAA